MAIHIRRREFIFTLGAAAAAWPLAARAQQPANLPTIGLLGAATPSAWSQWVAAFERRPRELGWIEGSTVSIKYRWAEGRDERYAEIAAEFVRLKVDVIVTTGGAVLAIKRATSVIPIVFAMVCDSGRIIHRRASRAFRCLAAAYSHLNLRSRSVMPATSAAMNSRRLSSLQPLGGAKDDAAHPSDVPSILQTLC
jgi:hypothetical protein